MHFKFTGTDKDAYRCKYLRHKIHVLSSYVSQTSSTLLFPPLPFFVSKISRVPFLIFCQFRCSAVHYIYLFRIINTTERTGGLAKSHRAVRGAFCGCTDRFTTQMFINRGKVNEAWRGINQQTLMSENWSGIIILMGCLLYLSICTHLLFSLHRLPLPRRAFNFLHCCSSPSALRPPPPPPPETRRKVRGLTW